MKTIKLTLWTDEPENRYSYTISLNDKDYTKAKKVIAAANKNMPDIRTIQDEYLMSDELDFIMESLNQANISVLPLEICFSWDVDTGVATKDEYEKFLSTVPASAINPGERVSKLSKPKSIQLHLMPEDPENTYDWTIAIEEDELSSAEKIIQSVCDPHVMPDIRTIQDELDFSDELDIVENTLNSAGINTMVVSPTTEISIQEGIKNKSQADKFLSTLKPKAKKGNK